MRSTAVENLVVVGGGMAGLRTAQGLRNLGFEGRIQLVSDEAHLPYDRPPLSKEFLRGELAADAPMLVTTHELAEQGIELVRSAATGLDVVNRRIQTATSWIAYDRAVIATGSVARRFPEGHGTGSPVAVLRALDDALALRKELANARSVTVIGGGLIGCEVAATCVALGLDVSIVEPAPTLMMRSFGEQLGSYLETLHRERGIRVVTGSGVSSVTRRSDSSPRKIELISGEYILADAVVAGIGADPSVEWLMDSGLAVENGLLCDSTLTTSSPDVMVAGDVANVMGLDGVPVRSEQWINAVDQARHVAANLLLAHDQRSTFEGSGYFWSNQHGLLLQGVGSHQEADIVVHARDPETHTFLATAVRDGKPVGLFAAGNIREFAQERQRLGFAA